jgi:long-chain acyl-CoA synthetase
VNLLDQWEASVARAPDAAAVRYFGDTLTFGEIDSRAQGFGGWLQSQGVRPGDRVAIQMQNDPEFLVAQYGIWQAGAIAVPMSPMFKEREVAYQLADCGAKLMVDRETVQAAPAQPLRRESPHDLAYLVYTSGTTGEPKGAMCPHRCMVHTSGVFEQLLGIAADDIILGAAPLFHVTGLVAHMALSARCGIPLVLFHRFEAERAWRTIEQHRPTVTVAAITAYIALLNHPLASRERFRSMTKCFTGGAPVAASFVERFEREMGVYIHNTYGLTESNSPSHITPLGERAPVDPATGALAVGRPVPGCEATLIDGEIALRGANIFPGYWNRPEATAACFRDGWFLTGDIGIRDAHGWYYVVDRKKDMIVCSGFKVYPREVEDVLYRHPSVREAAVVGVPDDYRGETVKAFVSLRGAATEDELIAFCRERMAAYKYPRSVEFLDELPKTATGKFLRRALRGLTASS